MIRRILRLSAYAHNSPWSCSWVLLEGMIGAKGTRRQTKVKPDGPGAPWGRRAIRHRYLPRRQNHKHIF